VDRGAVSILRRILPGRRTTAPARSGSPGADPDAGGRWGDGRQSVDASAVDEVAHSPNVVYWRDLQRGAIVRRLGALADDVGVSALLDHCGRTYDLTRKEWAAECPRLCAATPHATQALQLIAEREEQLPAGSTPETEDFVIGVVRMLPFLGADVAVPLLVRMADQNGRAKLSPGHERVARAAVRALGGIGGELALPPLRRIKAESPLSSLRKAASSELDKVLQNRGLNRAEVPEWLAATFELNADGERLIALRAGYSARIRVRPGGRVQIDYRNPAGQWLATKPSARTIGLGTEPVTRLADGIRAVVRAEKHRLKQILDDGREIDVATWQAHYLDHPVTGQLARTLIWQQTAYSGGDWETGVPTRDAADGSWHLRTGLDDRVALDEAGRVRLLRPLKATSREGKAWIVRLRRWKLEQAVSQFE
jgi:hypothetical protein